MAIWNQLQELLFGRAQPAPQPPLSFETAGQQVQPILELDLSTAAARERHSETVLQVLRLLDTEIEQVRILADGYPEKPISAAVWMNGAGYSSLARALTEHFKSAGWLHREETASALWAKATLAVNSHYHHLVGPAMLANADCHERLGNAARAAEMYSSVIKDFMSLAEAWRDDPDSPDEDDRAALACLKTAASRMEALGHETVDHQELAAVVTTVDRILSRPSIAF